MKNNPLITVCVTSYNHERYIRECIDSVLNQTYPHTHVHVIDDCSTDRSAEILRSYGDRIELTVREKNLGLPAYNDTINDSIRAAEGEFFYRLDSDDFLEPNYFKRMIEEVNADPKLDWVCGGLNVVDQDSRIIDTWEYTSWPTDPDTALARGWHSCSVVVPHNGILRTDFIRDNDLYWRFFPYGWGSDVLFTIQAMKYRPAIKLISGPGLNWRTHGKNNSCDVVRRINLVLAVREYYAENIPESIYLKNPLMNEYPVGSDDYLATKFFLLAVSLYHTKAQFRVPTIFRGPDTKKGIEDNLYLFNTAIRKYTERSLSYSKRYRNELNSLREQIEAEGQVREGKRFLSAGDFKQATDRFKQVLLTNPKSTSALTGLTEARFAAGDVAAAQRYSLQAMQVAPHDPRALNNAGVLMYNMGDFDRAEKSFRKAAELDPECLDIHVNLLDLYASINQQELLDPDQQQTMLTSARWVADKGSDNPHDELMRENTRLRLDVLDRYTDRYAKAGIRILLHRPDNGALKYLMDSWAEVLNTMGIPTELLHWGENTRDKIARFRPTVFITVSDPAYIEQLDMTPIRQYRHFHRLQIGHITTLEHSFEPVDFFITFHLDPSRDNRFSRLGRPLLSLPFAINPLRHYMRPGREVWDYFFVGTNSRLKTDQTAKLLIPIIKNYHGLLAGVGWPAGAGELPLDEVARLYSLAHISPNYHIAYQYDLYNEINERTYIIPACGGFELTDNPAAMKDMFAPDEMAVARSPQEYHEMFHHFLEHPEQRLAYIRKGMQRVYREYTLFHVLERLTEHLGVKSTAPDQTKVTA